MVNGWYHYDNVDTFHRQIITVAGILTERELRARVMLIMLDGSKKGNNQAYYIFFDRQDRLNRPANLIWL